MNDVEREAQRIEEGDAWQETDEVVEIEVKRPLDVVIPIRLSSEQWQAVRQEARDRGTNPAILIRAWVLEKLGGMSAAPSTRERRL